MTVVPIMRFELSQRFFFEAAHTLHRTVDDPQEIAGSLRIHGHTYLAEVTVSGQPSSDSGMLVDLAVLREKLAIVRSQLDHHFLDEVPGLGQPTLENLCVFIAQQLQLQQCPVDKVRVWREASGDSCLLHVNTSTA